MPFNWPFSKTYKHPCPDGTVRIVHRCVDDAFPLFIPGWEGKMNGNLEDLKGSPVNLAAEYTTKIKGLLFSLDDLNQSLMMAFRSSYIAFQTDPCSSDGFFKRQVGKIIDEQHRLTKLRVQIRGLISLAEMNNNNPEKVWPIYQQIVDQIGGSSVKAAASLEIAESRKIADEWVGGEHGR